MERYLYKCFFCCRSYISFDILRRILTDYFGYDVLYVMNITDIDDKIIKRARQNYLYEKYVQNHDLNDMLKDTDYIKHAIEKIATITDFDKRRMIEKIMYATRKAAEDLDKIVREENGTLYQKVLFNAKNLIFKIIYY